MSEPMALRMAEPADIAAFYGEPPKHTMKAIVGEIAGRVVAIVGMVYPGRGRAPCLFSEFLPGAPRDRRGIVRAGRMALAKFATVPIFAVANQDEPTAPRFLTFLGFQLVGHGPAGALYRYDPAAHA